MRSNLLDLCEVVCLAAVAVAVGFLFGLWWGVLVGAVLGVIYLNLPVPGGSSRRGDS